MATKIHPNLDEDTEEFLQTYTRTFGVSQSQLINRALRRFARTMSENDRAKLHVESPIPQDIEDDPINLTAMAGQGKRSR